VKAPVRCWTGGDDSGGGSGVLSRHAELTPRGQKCCDALHYYRKTAVFDRLLKFNDVKVDLANAPRR
jgi:hypothetical protein